jgi:hypothetical protein
MCCVWVLYIVIYEYSSCIKFKLSNITIFGKNYNAFDDEFQHTVNSGIKNKLIFSKKHSSEKTQSIINDNNSINHKKETHKKKLSIDILEEDEEYNELI